MIRELSLLFLIFGKLLFIVMLLKKIKLRRGVLIYNSRKDIIFKRVRGSSICFLDWANFRDNDERCKFKSSCPIKFTCSMINTPKYNNYSYIPSV